MYKYIKGYLKQSLVDTTQFDFAWEEQAQAITEEFQRICYDSGLVEMCIEHARCPHDSEV